MPFNGSGQFNRVHNWTSDAANSIDINATEMDAEDNGFAAGLSNCVTRDGQGKMNADFTPAVANEFNLGTASLPWATLNGVPIASFITPTQNGLGQILYPQSQIEINAGVTPTNYFYPVGTVDRYGTNTTPGTTDMTAAINTAIRVMNNITVYSTGNIGNPNGSSPDLGRGGTVTFLGTVYLTTGPILGAPFVTLLGACRVNQSGTNFTSTQGITIIRANFGAISGASNGAYVIDTGNWRLLAESGHAPVTPYRVIDAADQFYVDGDKDAGVGTWCPGFSVINMLIDCNSTAFGGIRQQCASNFRIDGVAVINAPYTCLATLCCYEFAIGAFKGQAPIAWWLGGCESGMQDAGELWLAAIATSAWVSGNQTLINNVFYPYAVAGTPNCGFINQAVWYNLATKCLLAALSENITLGYTIIQNGTVGIEAMEANINILHMENEQTGNVIFLCRTSSRIVVDGLKNKVGIPLCTGDGESVIIRQPHFLACSTTFTPFNSETSSPLEVLIYDPRKNPDAIEGSTARFSTINLTRIYPAGALGVPTTIWVNDSTGSASLDGFQQGTPTTLNGALQWIVNNPHIPTWIVKLKDAQTATISVAQTITGTRITFERDGTGGSAATLALTASPILDRATIILQSLGVTFSGANFLVAGQVNFEITAASVTIPAASVIWQCYGSTSARMTVTGWGTSIAFGSGAGLCSGGVTPGFINYEDSFGGTSTSGTAALEAGTSGKVRKIASSIV